MIRPKRNPDVQTKMLPDGHVVIFSQQSDWAHTITPLAAIAWEYCDGEHSIEQIVEQVLTYTEAPNVAEIQPAITALLNDFVQGGLVSDTNA
ncbi:MAG: PqqD family protein [Cyanobacteria bacterium SZAS-4]|nr:PqqD family protein [Cyanobacteria bacterium SZAS-4]